jgi:hypothetical protein
MKPIIRIGNIFAKGKPFSRWISENNAGLSTLAAFAAVFVTIVVMWSQNSLTREITKQQFFLQFYQQWESDEMQTRRADLAESLLKNPIPANIDDSPLLFLETLAEASKRGLIDRDLMWTTFSVDVINYWAAAQPYVKRIRQEEQCSCLFAELEGLHNRLLDESRRRGEQQSLFGRDEGSIHRFLEWEKRRKSTESNLKEAQTGGYGAAKP